MVCGVPFPEPRPYAHVTAWTLRSGRSSPQIVRVAEPLLEEDEGQETERKVPPNPWACGGQKQKWGGGAEDFQPKRLFAPPRDDLPCAVLGQQQYSL